ncbi:DUF6578 domain-containing protein [Kineococcus sp. LSe6-4]|uniref:DUF6578 domain-containing protein n=1 Tax=Kineococcus halophytocola TaxID=3234027 RepID=A0ABV4GW73_9ACTN
MEVIVEVGGWEHECCGAAVERGDVVTFTCFRHLGPDGRVRLIESHHDLGADERVHGRVLDVHVVEGAGSWREQGRGGSRSEPPRPTAPTSSSPS